MTEFVNFFELSVLDVLISWHCDVNYEAGLDWKVPEDLGVIIPGYFFWSYPPVFAVLKVVLSTYGPVYY